MCKDFVVSPLQVYEARYYGADAILLMLSVLDDKTYKKCEEAAQRLNLDIILRNPYGRRSPARK